MMRGGMTRPRLCAQTLRAIACAMLMCPMMFCAVMMCGCAIPPAGPMDQQQARAVIHDPFPQNDIGPYEAASRPPGYQQPLPLPVRNRIAPDAFRMSR